MDHTICHSRMKPRLTPHFIIFFLGSLKVLLLFFKLIVYNPLPSFLFIALPTPDALWEGLTKERK